MLIVQLMLMAVIRAFIMPMSSRAAAPSTGEHHPNKQPNEDDPDPASL
jgi:hypothetical protein